MSSATSPIVRNIVPSSYRHQAGVVQGLPRRLSRNQISGSSTMKVREGEGDLCSPGAPLGCPVSVSAGLGKMSFATEGTREDHG